MSKRKSSEQPSETKSKIAKLDINFTSTDAIQKNKVDDTFV